MGRNYKICPRCGDHLDHGERCDCMDRRREAAETARAATPGRGYRPKILLADTIEAERLAAKAHISRA